MFVMLFAGLLTSEDPDRVCACLQAADGLLRRHISTTKEVRSKDSRLYLYIPYVHKTRRRWLPDTAEMLWHFYSRRFDYSVDHVDLGQIISTFRS